MAHQVVCISRVTAAGGDVIGHLVAERLGFRYVDDEVVTLAAEHAGIDSSVVASVEHHKGLLARILEPLFAPPPAIKGYLERRPRAYAGADVRSSSAPAEQLRRLIKDAIVEIAQRGRAVIVAHAASMALARDPGVLRVLVTASVATRIRRLSVASPIVSEDEHAKAVAESDRQRREYLSRFYGVDDESPTHYDLVINTDVLEVGAAVTAIVALATA